MRSPTYKLLTLVGKKRAVYIPKIEKDPEPYGYYVAKQESFFSALMRPRDEKPTEGWVYWDWSDLERQV